MTFTVDEHEDSWRRVRTEDGRFHLAIPELLDELASLAEPPVADPAYPFVLSAGERRSFTANTIFRDPTWRKRDAEGALRLNRADAERLGVADGGRARLTTKRASLEVVVELSDLMQPGHISLPNGLGVDYPGEDGAVECGRGAQRAHRRRGPGLAGRHAMAQARPGAPRTHRLGRARAVRVASGSDIRSVASGRQ